MAYCLNDTGEVIVGFKKMSPRDILCILEVEQAVKYMGYLPRLFMSLNFFHGLWKYEIVCEKMRAHRTLAASFSKHMGSIAPHAFIKLCTCPERLLYCCMTTSGLSHHLSFPF